MAARAMAFESRYFGGLAVVCSQDDACASDRIADLLEFLCFSGRNVIRVVFEVDEFAAPVLRKLSPDRLEELRDTKQVIVGRFRIYYIPGVMFQVGEANKRYGTAYFGIKNFLNIPGLLPAPPLDEVQATGQELLDAIDAVGLGGEHLRLTSPAAVFLASDRGSRFMPTVPLGRDLPPDVLRDATGISALADDKYWVEAHQIGKWGVGELWDYDLTMAFGAICADLIDIRDLNFWRSDHIGVRELRATYGVVEGRFSIDLDGEYAHCSPIVARLPNGLMGCAVGNLLEDGYTLDEIRTVERYGIGIFIQTGNGIFASPKAGVMPRRPYREIMDWLYGQRRVSEMAGKICKTAANALIGKMIEKREDAPYRNRFYHAQITASTRCRITQFLCDNQVTPEELVAVQTDGVKLARDIQLPEGGMGEWRNNGTHDCIVHSGRKVYEGGKRPFKVTYADVERLVSEHPNMELYGVKAPHYLTLSEAIELGAAIMVGELVNLPTHFDLRAMDTQLTRVFQRLPRTGVELVAGKYRSSPVVFE